MAKLTYYMHFNGKFEPMTEVYSSMGEAMKRAKYIKSDVKVGTVMIQTERSVLFYE